MDYTFENIRKNGLLLYEYVRGSVAQGTNLPTSDVDTGGVFIMPKRDILGITQPYISEVNDGHGDNVWYEAGKYLSLLCKANPTMLESLFVDRQYILYCHPAFQPILDFRDMFVTKETFKSFLGYAKSQIEKAQGKHKRFMNEVNDRRTPIDFCYCPNDECQGTMLISNWLAKRGLKQRYCGLSRLPHMTTSYAVFYDYGTHLRVEFKDYQDWNNYWRTCDDLDYALLVELRSEYPGVKWNVCLNNDEEYRRLLSQVPPKGYHGIQKDDGSSDELRLDSIIKGDKQKTQLSYNKEAYSTHCREYRETQEWKEKRNPVRYAENQGAKYDRKNMMHCMRLIHMGIEIATTGKVNVNREKIDREYLLAIRRGEIPYEELLAEAKRKEAVLKAVIDTCLLPETVDREFVNLLLLKIRDKFN